MKQSHLQDGTRDLGFATSAAWPRAARRRAIGASHAFTLIELLVVVMIMCIVVGLVIGVAFYVHRESARKQALANEAMLKNALSAYFNVHGFYPKQAVVPIGGREDSTSQWWVHTSGGNYPCLDPQAMRNMSLLTQLTAEPACSNSLGRLPSNYFGYFPDVSGRAGTNGSFVMSAALPACYTNGYAKVLVDGFGTLFDYQDGTNPKNLDGVQDTPGSVSGSFVIISAGQDGIFNDPPYNIYSADDVRSDVH